MKQTIVIKVSMNGQSHKSCFQYILSAVGFSMTNARSKSLKIAVSVQGVEKAAFGGKEKDQIEVTGDGIDAVQLTDLLRRRVGFADLISVTPVDEEKKEKKEEPIVVWSYGVPQYQIYEISGSTAQYQYPYPCSFWW